MQSSFLNLDNIKVFTMPELEIRPGKIDEIDTIIDIYENAKRFMRKRGNTEQWSKGYPDKDTILNDIKNGYCYVGIDDTGKLALVFAFIIGEDPTYLHIEDGEWLNDNPYGTIHRIASTGEHPRMLHAAVEFGFQAVEDIRIDTHHDNSPMLKALARENFSRCGIIYCHGGTEPRIAFQKTKAAQKEKRD